MLHRNFTTLRFVKSDELVVCLRIIMNLIKTLMILLIPFFLILSRLESADSFKIMEEFNKLKKNNNSLELYPALTKPIISFNYGFYGIGLSSGAYFEEDTIISTEHRFNNTFILLGNNYIELPFGPKFLLLFLFFTILTLIFTFYNFKIKKANDGAEADAQKSRAG